MIEGRFRNLVLHKSPLRPIVASDQPHAPTGKASLLYITIYTSLTPTHMANLNKVFLMGNLTADPELRYTPKGTAVTDIRLAINRYYAGDNSERQEETTFVDVTLWNRQAEVAGNYLSKGRGVFVEGRLQLDSWEDKASGQKRTKLRVIGENIQLFPRGGEGDMGGAPRQQSQGAPRSNNYGQSQPRPAQNYNPPPMPPNNQSSNDFGDMDDEIPF